LRIWRRLHGGIAAIARTETKRPERQSARAFEQVPALCWCFEAAAHHLISVNGHRELILSRTSPRATRDGRNRPISSLLRTLMAQHIVEIAQIATPIVQTSTDRALDAI
jgi:hypothetical protein